MSTFSAEVTQDWTTSAPPTRALDHFADLDANIRHNVELESHERLDGQTLRMVLKEQRSGRTTYKPSYTLRWTRDPDGKTLRWSTVEGEDSSMRIRGVARFEGPVDGPTTIRWQEQVEADVPVNRLLAKAVGPVAEGLIRRGIRGFVERMIADLEG